MMAYRTRLRNTRSRESRSSAKPASVSKRSLRKRPTSLRYVEDDTQSESTVASPEPRVTEDCEGVDKEIAYSSAFEEGMKLQSSNVLHSSTYGNQFPSSGRSSVLSCDSYDSGVSSRSDDDPLCLPSTPEKPSKPITIEVVSPASRGVIELIDNGSDGFIGYYKPDLPSPARTPVKGQARGESVAPAGCCSCSLMKRSRITRSVSTNVSEDSCDSAFQGSGYQRHAHVGSGPHSSTPVSVNSAAIVKKNATKSAKVHISSRIKSAKVRQTNTKRSRKRDKSPVKFTNSLKRSKPSSTTKSSRSRLKERTSPGKRSPGKSALRRIQHHNSSPERSSEVAVPALASRHCRTRSHAKSLRKAIITSHISNKTSTPGPKSKHIKAHTKSAIHGPNSLERGYRAARGARASPVRRGATSSALQSKRDDDSGVGSSDDQRSCTSSACHWRFCKTEVDQVDLVDHMERLHVASQRRNSKQYRCYWEGCKVYGKVAKSIIWLEGHVRQHLGPRPFHCIFPDCVARFTSQELLQRHVDGHIDNAEPVKAARRVETPTSKKTDKKKIKRMRGTEKCILKRPEFFTSNVIEAARWQIKMLQEKWSHVLTEDRASLRLQGQIVAMETTEASPGEVAEKVQIHWHPEVFGVPDSWHDRREEIGKTSVKTVKLSNFPHEFILDLCRH